MIAYTYIHHASLERIKGVFLGIPVMTRRCEVGSSVQLSDDWTGPTVRTIVYDRLLVVESKHVKTIKDRCEDFGIKGMGWYNVPDRYGSGHAYRTVSGDIVFKFGQMRKVRRFEPDKPEAVLN